MSTVPQTTPMTAAPAASWIDTQILALATKVDPTDAAQLAALVTAGVRYALSKLNNVPALKPYLSELLAAEALV